MSERIQISKVYIICPRQVTGGPRSLYQLSDVLFSLGYKVYIIHIDLKTKKYVSMDTGLFPNCKADISTVEIEDSSNNLLVIPETFIEYSFPLSYIKKIIWWLSLDYYCQKNVYKFSVLQMQRKALPAFVIPLYCLYRIIVKKQKINSEGYLKTCRDFKEYYHLYNCEYEKEFLEKMSLTTTDMSYLCGPIDICNNIDYREIVKSKKNTIAYNCVKSNRIFMKILLYVLNKKIHDVRIVPIKGMNHKQVLETLKETKVYLDMGYFPGPERLPREAVSCYCNLIVAKVGSSKNLVDIPIPQKYKYRLSYFNIPSICNGIIKSLNEYEYNLTDFDRYREKVYWQINHFEECIKDLFEYKLTRNHLFMIK